MEIEKAKCCDSKHIVVSVLVVATVAILFGVLGYLLGIKSEKVVIENITTKDAEVNQIDVTEKEVIKNDEVEKKEKIIDETADWKTYENNIYNYRLDYPSDWLIEKETHLGDYAPSISSPKNSEIAGSLMISAGAANTSSSAKQGAEENKQFMKKIIKEEEIIVGGINGYKIIYTAERAGLGGINSDYVIQKIFLVHNNKLFSLSYEEQMQIDPYTMINDYEKWTYTNTLNQMLSTFNFAGSEEEIADWRTYTNEKYGFEVTLSDLWKGYSVLTETWDGTTLDGNSTQYQGPQIIIRNPKWSTTQYWQDIPVMVFTKDQWNLVEAQNLNVSAAPVGPQKLDENQNYVFALPPRWVGFTDALGQDEAQAISKTIKALSL